MPTFSRQSGNETADADQPVAARGTTPVRERTDPPPPPAASRVTGPTDETTSRWTAPQVDDRNATTVTTPKVDDRDEANRAARLDPERDVTTDTPPHREPPAAGPRPRASFLATTSLILGVAGALLVLSGPLLGYGIGVAGLALVLALAGLRATRRRHVAGKTDALIGLVLAIGAITLGVLALTGSVNWLGTDMQPVNNLREWLDAQVIDRF